jgi:thiol-disulfide isomerase/thioredoxin
MKSVLVLIMDGCPACHDYMPRFGALAAPYRAKGMPVSILDLNADSKAQLLADRLKVEATPTTITIGPRGARKVAEGAVGNKEIAKLLRDAAKD